MASIAPLGGKAHRGMRYRLHVRRHRAPDPIHRFDHLARWSVQDLYDAYAENREAYKKNGFFRTEDVHLTRSRRWFMLRGERIWLCEWSHPRFGQGRAERLYYLCPRCGGKCRVLYGRGLAPNRSEWLCRRCRMKQGFSYYSQCVSPRWKEYERRCAALHAEPDPRRPAPAPHDVAARSRPVTGAEPPPVPPAIATKTIEQLADDFQRTMERESATDPVEIALRKLAAAVPLAREVRRQILAERKARRDARKATKKE